MRRVIVFAGIVVSGLCVASEPIRIPSAKSDFCLPPANRIADIPWVPEDKPGTPRSFAFAGCATMAADSAEHCGTPESILSGVVAERSTYHPQRWKDFGQTSMIRQISEAPDASMISEAGGTFVIVHNEKLWDRDWYVWQKAKKLRDEGRPHMDDDDLLVATCHHGTGTAASGSVAPLVCKRSVLTEDLSLEFTYKTDSMVPKDLVALDASVIAAIDQWRCNIKGKQFQSSRR